MNKIQRMKTYLIKLGSNAVSAKIQGLPKII